MVKKTLVAKVTFIYTMDGCHALMHTLLIFFLDFFSLIFCRGRVCEVVKKKMESNSEINTL